MFLYFNVTSLPEALVVSEAFYYFAVSKQVSWIPVQLMVICEILSIDLSWYDPSMGCKHPTLSPHHFKRTVYILSQI